jgi:membrane-bound metal-dependent hydrolase YbcI (DUF457 family)
VDNLTHSLFGWTLARAGAGRGIPYATATLVLASNAPDLDIVMVVRGGIDYLAAHRGPTHGPLGVVGLGLLVAGVVAAWARWRDPDAVTWRGFARWWALAMAGIVGHIALDLPTAYGTRLLSPFDGTWYALDWMPIIDVYLWGVLAAGLVAGRVTGRRARAAVVALALMGIDYAGRAVLHERALAHGAAFDASGAPAPCASAPTLVRHRAAATDGAGHADACLAAAALPTFVSPFTWRVVRQHRGRYELSDRAVLGPSTTGRALLTSDAGPDVQRARATRAGAVYLDFARFPIARVTSAGPPTTVRLFDARFVGLPPNDDLTSVRTNLSVAVTLVPWKRDSLHKSRSAAPGWQGAKSESIGHKRAMSNAARRDAPPGHCGRYLVSRGLDAQTIGSSRGRGPLGKAASIRARSAAVN